MDMDESVTILRESVELQRKMCRRFIAMYGTNHSVTKNAIYQLGKIFFLYNRAKERCKANE